MRSEIVSLWESPQRLFLSALFGSPVLFEGHSMKLQSSLLSLVSNLRTVLSPKLLGIDSISRRGAA